MKLEEIARKSIEIIREGGSDGIATEELAKRLGVPKRRLYDVKAILAAADLITTSRDRFGTKIRWNRAMDFDSGPNISRFKSKRVRITTSGVITNVSNKGTEVIIEGSIPNFNAEAL